MSSDVRFIRKNGRVIPIRGGKKQKYSKSHKRTNRAIAVAGVGSLYAGMAGVAAGGLNKSASKINATRAYKTAAMAINTPKGHIFRKPLADHAVKLAQTSIKQYKKGTKLTRFGALGIAAGFGALSLNIYRNNRARKKK